MPMVALAVGALISGGTDRACEQQRYDLRCDALSIGPQTSKSAESPLAAEMRSMRVVGAAVQRGVFHQIDEHLLN